LLLAVAPFFGIPMQYQGCRTEPHSSLSLNSPLVCFSHFVTEGIRPSGREE
jgi:hypothetical protein